MRFLVTNDNGITSPGLVTIVEALQNFGEVSVVCPSEEKRAVGHSISFQKPLYVNETKVFGGSVKAWTINGTPADCVKVAMEVLLPNEIDFVVSGMNIGSNIGRDSYYSGTIGGAREASFYGLPAVAVSLDVVDALLTDFSAAEQLFTNTMEIILENQFPRDLLLNINIPDVEESQCKGVKFAELDYSIQRHKYIEVSDASAIVCYWLENNQEDQSSKNLNSDFRLLKEDYFTVTPLEVQLTDQYYKREIEHWFKESHDTSKGSLL